MENNFSSKFYSKVHVSFAVVFSAVAFFNYLMLCVKTTRLLQLVFDMVENLT